MGDLTDDELAAVPDLIRAARQLGTMADRMLCELQRHRRDQTTSAEIQAAAERCATAPHPDRIATLETEVARLRGECNDAADRDAKIYQLRSQVAQMTPVVAAADAWRARAHIAELNGTIGHLRNALQMLHREAGRDWLDGVRSDAALDALEYASRTLKATTPGDIDGRPATEPK
jgi:small-conductance mechanosensitive channel